jgi:KUP system potassium uptake protein
MAAATGGMRKAPSLEWRWVSTEDDDDEDRAGDGAAAAVVGAVSRGGSFESEDDEDDEEEEDEEKKGRKRLIRTVPSVDWFDVEGNEVSVAQQLDDSEVRGGGGGGGAGGFVFLGWG